MASTEPDIIGRVLGGRYTVDALIGRGGFGAVYRGTHLRLGDTVAIKIITDPPPDLSARFHREAKVQRRLRHPVTVRLLDLDVEADGLHYMVQEYVEGRTLKTVLRDEGPLAPWRLVALMIAVLDALDEAHALGIIHRDLKPENIMVVDGRSGEEPRLLDFGIAKLRDRDASDETLTAQGMVLGTLAYMAPEQVVRGPLGPPTDVYQLGAVMYRLLSGRKPFTGTAQDVLRQHLAAPPPPLPALVPPPLAAVVMRAMEKEQAHRFATAQAMRDALVAARAAILQTSPAVPRLDLGDSLSGSLPPAAVASEPSGSSSLLHPRGELDEAPALRLAVTRPRQIAALTAVAALLALGVVAAAWWRFDRGADTDEAERIIVGAAPQAAGQGRGAAAAAPVDGIDVIGADVIGAIDAIKGIGAADGMDDADEAPGTTDAAPEAAPDDTPRDPARAAAPAAPPSPRPTPRAAPTPASRATPTPAPRAAPAAEPTPAARIAAAEARAAAAQARAAERLAAAERAAAAARAAPAERAAESTRAFAAALQSCTCARAQALLAELSALDPPGDAGRRRLYRNACQIAGPESCLR